MTHNEGYPTDWFTVEVSGFGADKASLKMVDNGWVISADDLENIVVNTYNKEVEANTSFSTEYSEALIYEIDENTIGIAVDTDSNGTYETTINTDQKTAVADTDIFVGAGEYVFDGNKVEPKVAVELGDSTLEQGKDYTVEYIDNDKLGTAQVIITGIGDFIGTDTVYFDIVTKDEYTGDDSETSDDEDTAGKGDVNGDGSITVTDISKVAAHVKGIRSLSGYEQKRADVNGDGMITVTDISMIAAHIKGIRKLIRD